MMFSRFKARHSIALASVLVVGTLAVVVIEPDTKVEAAGGNPYTQAPAGLASLPLPADTIMNYADGRPVAAKYYMSFQCPTTPDSDLDPPFDHGDGHKQAQDSKEYQVPPCFFGREDILDKEMVEAAFRGVQPMYAIVPWFDKPSLYGANNEPSDIQGQCPQPGPPWTELKGPAGTCIMHMTHLHFPNTFEQGFQPPSPAPMPTHSHIIEGNRHPPTWWFPRAVQVLDRSIWPDHTGNCPAGRDQCITSIKAMREAQRKGQARPDVGSNILLYYSIQPIGGIPGLADPTD